MISSNVPSTVSIHDKLRAKCRYRLVVAEIA